MSDISDLALSFSMVITILALMTLIVNFDGFIKILPIVLSALFVLMVVGLSERKLNDKPKQSGN